MANITAPIGFNFRRYLAAGTDIAPDVPALVQYYADGGPTAFYTDQAGWGHIQELGGTPNQLNTGIAQEYYYAGAGVARLNGDASVIGAGYLGAFRVNTGVGQISLRAGRHIMSDGVGRLRIFDGHPSLHRLVWQQETISGTNGKVMDIKGTVFDNAAAWESGNATHGIPSTTGVLYFVYGGLETYSRVSYLKVESVAPTVNVTAPIGFNFRNIQNSATDTGGDVYVDSEYATSLTTWNYDASRGWGYYRKGLVGGGVVDAPPGFGSRTQWLGGSPARFTGHMFAASSGAEYFRVNLAPGVYSVRLVMQADAGAKISFWDGDDIQRHEVSSSSQVIGTNYIDATGAVRTSEADWTANNAAQNVTVVNGFMIMQVGANDNVTGGNTMVRHMDLTLVQSLTPPTTTNPSDVTRVIPATATFSCTVAGGANTGMRWQTRATVGGAASDISGAVSNTYTTPATTLPMGGSQYRLAVDWAGGTVYSNWATLSTNVGVPGTPGSVTVSAVNGTTLAVDWTDASPTADSYEVQVTPSASINWIASSAPTTTDASITGLSPATSYLVRVRSVNPQGQSAWVQAGPEYTDNVGTGGTGIPASGPESAPSITSQPSSQTVTAGQSVTFSVAVSGTGPFTYQWRKGGVNVSGAVSSSYTIASPVVGDSGSYTVVVTGSVAPPATSNAAVLTVNAPSVTATLTTPVMKNNLGVIYANQTGIVVNVYHPTTGALVLRKTGLTSSALGVVTFSDAALVAGTTYAYEVVLSSGIRRLPVITVA